MECANDDEGISCFTYVPFVGCAQEQVQVFGSDKVVEVFLAYLLNGLILAVAFFAVPVQLANFPILDHQLALDSSIIPEAVREFEWELRHDPEIFEALILEEMPLFHAVQNASDFFVRPFGLGGLCEESHNLGRSEHDKRDLIVVRETNYLFQVGVDLLVTKNQLPTLLPFTIGAVLGQEFDRTRAKNAVTLGSLIPLITSNVLPLPIDISCIAALD